MNHYEPIDYLVIGHLTKDIIPGGWKLGGTAAYSALTAHALGMKVGIVTCGEFESIPGELNPVQVCLHNDNNTSTFENIQTAQGRIQFLHAKAKEITPEMVPLEWRKVPILHLGPIMQEVSFRITEHIQSDLICLTPQGWLRTTDQNGKVIPTSWKEENYALRGADIVILSEEDVLKDEQLLAEFQGKSNIFVVTKGFAGSHVYAKQQNRYFHAPEQSQVDPTGAGDIYSTCFFIKYYQTKDPWLAAEFATHIAANSVTRVGLDSVPRSIEISNYDITINRSGNLP